MKFQFLVATILAFLSQSQCGYSDSTSQTYTTQNINKQNNFQSQPQLQSTNYIDGANSYANGIKNFIKGDNVQVDGDLNQILGNSNIAKGDSNRIKGDGNVIIGNNNVVQPMSRGSLQGFFDNLSSGFNFENDPNTQIANRLKDIVKRRNQFMTNYKKQESYASGYSKTKTNQNMVSNLSQQIKRVAQQRLNSGTAPGWTTVGVTGTTWSVPQTTWSSGAGSTWSVPQTTWSSGTGTTWSSGAGAGTAWPSGTGSGTTWSSGSGARGNVVVGNFNNVEGSKNNVKGNNNDLTGNINILEGNNNRLKSNNTYLKGSNISYSNGQWW